MRKKYNFCFTQCGYFIIFPSPRFYAESFLGILKSKKFANLTHLEALILIYVNFCFLLFVKSEGIEGITVCLEHRDSSKLISRKIWITEKSWNFHTVLGFIIFYVDWSGSQFYWFFSATNSSIIHCNTFPSSWSHWIFPGLAILDFTM